VPLLDTDSHAFSQLRRHGLVLYRPTASRWWWVQFLCASWDESTTLALAYSGHLAASGNE